MRFLATFAISAVAARLVPPPVTNTAGQPQVNDNNDAQSIDAGIWFLIASRSKQIESNIIRLETTALLAIEKNRRYKDSLEQVKAGRLRLRPEVSEKLTLVLPKLDEQIQQIQKELRIAQNQLATFLKKASEALAKRMLREVSYYFPNYPDIMLVPRQLDLVEGGLEDAREKFENIKEELYHAKRQLKLCKNFVKNYDVKGQNYKAQKVKSLTDKLREEKGNMERLKMQSYELLGFVELNPDVFKPNFYDRLDNVHDSIDELDLDYEKELEPKEYMKRLLLENLKALVNRKRRLHSETSAASAGSSRKRKIGDW